MKSKNILIITTILLLLLLGWCFSPSRWQYLTYSRKTSTKTVGEIQVDLEAKLKGVPVKASGKPTILREVIEETRECDDSVFVNGFNARINLIRGLENNPLYFFKKEKMVDSLIYFTLTYRRIQVITPSTNVNIDQRIVSLNHQIEIGKSQYPKGSAQADTLNAFARKLDILRSAKKSTSAQQIEIINKIKDIEYEIYLFNK